MRERRDIRRHLALQLRDRLRDRRGRERRADAPARHRVGLGKTGDRDRARLGLLAERRDAGRLHAVIDEMLVHLVGENVEVVLHRDGHDGLEFLARVDRAGRIRRRI